MAYRFGVGSRVLCRVGPEEWAAGEVVQITYREPSWPKGKTVPYQVLLEDGRLIFVPMDLEQLCRKLVLPWFYQVFEGKPGSYFAQDPSPQCLSEARGDEDVNERDHLGSTALLEAVRLNWRSGISVLIGMSADVNRANFDSVHPLHVAAAAGGEAVQTLLDARADPNRQDTDPDRDPDFTSKTFGDHLEHRTPLHYCCLRGDAACVMSLIRARAKLDLRDGQLKTPLHLAIDEGEMEVVDVLLQAKADMNIGNTESGLQNTPLMDAARAGDLAMATRLIAARADVNRQGRQDMGALHLAVRRGDAEIVQALVAARGDPEQRSACGSSMELAKKNSGAQVLKSLGVSDAEAVDSSKVKSIAALSATQRAALFLG